MQFAQILVTDDQALKTRLALDLILQDPERYEMTDEERADYERLAVFFGLVATNPSHFAPSGDMARTVKSIIRRAKGPAQPQSQSKRRAKRSQGKQKRDRAARRLAVEQYNEAYQAYEKDRLDFEEYERELIERFEKEPKVMILRADGQVIMSDIPASMVVPMDAPLTEADFEQAASDMPEKVAPRIFVPGSHEKAMQREADEVAAENARIERETAEYFHGDER